MEKVSSSEGCRRQQFLARLCSRGHSIRRNAAELETEQNEDTAKNNKVCVSEVGNSGGDSG